MSEKWFNVPGQNCPVALGGVPCNSNIDCEIAVNELCPVLNNGPVPWTTGKIASSSAGNIRCDPFRNVCSMYEKFDFEKENENWVIGVL